MTRTALMAYVSAVVVSLSACDSGGGTVAPFSETQQLVRVVSTATAQGGSAKFSTEIGVGSVQTKGRGQARFDGANTALSTVMDIFGESWEIRLVDKTLYVKVPEAARGGVSGDKPWIKVVRDGQDPFSQAIGGSLDQLAQQNDPLRTVDQIKKAGTITRGERSRFEGSAADHYWIDIELAKLADELPAGLTADAVRQMKGTADKFPLELWLNDRHLPVEVSMDLSPMLKAAGAPAESGAKITTKYTEWGLPLEVLAPLSDQVGEVPAPG